MAALPDLEDVQASLLSFYDTQARVLPWRRSSRPRGSHPVAPDGTWPTDGEVGAALGGQAASEFAYGVLVSEVMLQQTQVDRVKAYWVRWLAKWPTLAALATASEDEVNALWAGLGYYRRARFLLQGARYAAESHGGHLPDTHAALLKVPGVGAYTAAAVASIAFGQPHAAVDGNVVRVLSRLHARAQAAPGSSAAVKKMQALADALLAAERPGDWNQAMMELGATVCTPRAPRCDACPLAAHCHALRRSRLPGGQPVTAFPSKAAKAARRKEGVCVRAVEWADTRASPPQRWLLLLRRPAGGLLGGLWEFPAVASAAEEMEATRSIAVDALLAGLGLPEASAQAAAHVGEVLHVFSHIEHAMSVGRVTLSRAAAPPELSGSDWKWVEQTEDEPPDGLTGGVVKAWKACFGTKKRSR